MKKILMTLGVIVGALAMIPSVEAADINVSSGDDLATKIDEAQAGDVLILEDGTYTGNITIEKNLTIKGASKEGTIIDGQVTVEANLILDTLTVTSSYVDETYRNMVKVVNPDLIVEIRNSKLAVKDYVLDKDYKTGMSGIRVDATAEGTVLTVTNSEIYATYAVYVKSGSNDISIDNTSLNGWAALDISNITEVVSDNKVAVTNSTLTGVDYVALNDYNNYSVVQVGAQDNLALAITSSTVKNIVISGNRIDVIGFSDSYSASDNVTIEVTDTDLINTDTNGESAILNYGVAANVAGTMFAVDANSNMTSANNKTYEIAGDNVVLTLSTIEGDVVLTVPTGFELTEEILNSMEEVEGYTFDGWFTSEDYTTPVEVGIKVDNDTTIYAKFTKTEENVPTTPGTEDPEEDEKNPNTGDISFVMAIVVIVSAMAACGYVVRRIDKNYC